MPCMPSFIKLADRQQTQTNITFKIPSHGISANHIDFLICEKYIKAHYQPYIFELFLWESIDISKSTCIVTGTEIVFELVKSIPETWEKIQAEIDKVEKRVRRQEASEEYQKRCEEERDVRVKKNAELKRTAVKEQIVLDTKKHDYVKSVKENEKKKALKELQLWEEKTSERIEETYGNENEKTSRDKTKELETENKLIKQENVDDKEFSNAESIETSMKPISNLSKHVFKKSNDHTKYKSSFKPSQTPEIDTVTIPLPRKPQLISISFTPRDFPTPLRESKSEEENEWLTKQAAARRSAGFDSKDLLPEERNPQWLKAKGDEFFKAKNYLGAISAYTEGINISKEFVDLYINRSAVHMIVGNLQRTVDDCSKALEIMKPEVPANLEMRAICIARRGAALCKIGLVEQGKKELDIALNLVKNNKELKEEIVKIQMGFGTE